MASATPNLFLMSMADIKTTIRLESKALPIDSIVVYKDRAQIKRKIEIDAVPGIQEVVIHGLVGSVIKETVRVAERHVEPTKEAAKLTEDKLSQAKEEQKQLEKKISALQKELVCIDKQLDFLHKYSRLIDQSVSLNADKIRAGEHVAEPTHSPLSPAILAGLATYSQFYHTRTVALQLRRRELERLVEHAVESLRLVEKTLSQLCGSQSLSAATPSREVSIVLFCPSRSRVVILLSYLVHHAQWTPTYDVRVLSKAPSSGPTLQLTYYGTVQQATGEDWPPTARLVLSTAEPSFDGHPPPLPPCVLTVKRPMFELGGYYGSSLRTGRTVNELGARDMKTMPTRAIKELDEACDKLERSGGAGAALAVQTAAVSTGGGGDGAGGCGAVVTFTIPRPAPIDSDNKPHKVTVALLTLSPSFHYVAVPRFSEAAYLRATTKTLSTSPPLLAGTANVFFDNDFVATTSLPAASPGEEFETFLGADGAVRVKCLTVSSIDATHGGGGILGAFSSKKAMRTVERHMVVKNTKDVAIEITISDQLPLSDDEKIIVRAIEPPEDVLRETQEYDNRRNPAVQAVALKTETNCVEWTLRLTPGQEVVVPFKYSVEWPRERAIQGL